MHLKWLQTVCLYWWEVFDENRFIQGYLFMQVLLLSTLSILLLWIQLFKGSNNRCIQIYSVDVYSQKESIYWNYQRNNTPRAEGTISRYVLAWAICTFAPPGGGEYSQKNWVGVCGPLPKTLTLFMTKICDFPYPIYDLTKNLIPYLWPDP